MTKRKIAQWLTPLVGSAFAFALIVSAVVTTPTSAADTCTWTGIADGVTASNGGNWTGCDNGGDAVTLVTCGGGYLGDYSYDSRVIVVAGRT